MTIMTTKKTYVTIEMLIESVQERFLPKDLDLVERACAFAEEHYANIDHPTGKAYNEYNFSVAKLLADLGADPSVISTALIYPPPTLTNNALDNVKKQFKGENDLLELIEEVFRLNDLTWNVWATTPRQNDPKERREILQKMYLLAIGETQSKEQVQGSLMAVSFLKKEKQVENLIRMLLAGANDIRALIIKLADWLHFMRLLKDLSQNQKDLLQYQLLAKITLAIYAPLADRLGMWRLKSELEDMSFRLLQPDKYVTIAKQLEAKKQAREEYIEHIIIPNIKNKLNASGIKAKISGRAKHIYSIYQKMEAKELNFKQINDLLGIRIIVETIDDCYNAQSILHEFWLPKTDVYDGKACRDWIDRPKQNQYQSLHTTIYIQDKVVEVQIRTREMHEIAEYGAAAAHWRYKESKTYRRGKTPKVTDTRDQIWSKQLAEMRRSLQNGEESATSKQRSSLKDWIFVITPQGHVIDLPAGATALDFAYRIHTELGHRYTGAKIGDHLVRLDYELKNGEIVELITSRARSGPSIEWLTISKDRDGNSKYVFVRTRQARNKIQSWFNRQNDAQKSKLQK